MRFLLTPDDNFHGDGILVRRSLEPPKVGGGRQFAGICLTWVKDNRSSPDALVGPSNITMDLREGLD